MYHNLSSPIRARYIRLRPSSWIGGVSMRVELYGCVGEVKFWIAEKNSWVVQQMICNSLIFYPLCERYRALLFNFVFLNIWASQKGYSIFHFTLMVLLALNYNLSFNYKTLTKNLHFAYKSPCLALQQFQILAQIVIFSSLTLTSSAESNAIPSNFVLRFFVLRL